MKLSVKWLTILAMGVCVLCTVTATLVLAVRSTDEAIDRTNAQHDASVEQCFATGSQNILSLTTSLLQENNNVVSAEIAKFLNDVRSSYTEVSAVMEATPVEQVDDIKTFERYSALFWSMWKTRSLTLLAVGTPDGTGEVLTELQATQGSFRGDTERSLNSSILVTYDGKTDATLYGSLAEYGGFIDGMDCNPDFLTGTAISGPCPTNGFKLTHLPVIRQGLVFTNATDTVAADVHIPVGWGEIHHFPDFAGITLRGTFASTPVHPDRMISGYVQVAHDLRSVSAVIQQHLDGDHRVFVIIGGANRQLGLVVGSSHGTTTEVYEGVHPITAGPSNLTRPSHCTDASDFVVRGACEHVYEKSGVALGTYASDPFGRVYEEIVAAHEAVEVTISDEVFLMMMSPMNDSYGLEWWVVSLEQKALILGDVNEAREQVNANITSAAAKVNRDLEIDRVVMYIVIFSVVVVMFIICAVGTVYLVRPLEILKREMEDVARLKLDNLQSGRVHKSMLTEVASMQSSFLSMVASMQEYKQYMPQALLQRDDDEEDENMSDMQSDDSDDVSLSQKMSTPAGPGILPSETSGSRKRNSHHDSESADHACSSGAGASPNPALIIPASNISAGKRKNGLGVYLTKKARVTQLSMCCTDFNRFIRTTGDPTAIVDFHSKWLHLCVHDVQVNQGVLVCFLADNVDISFGGLSSCLNPPTKAARYALQVRGRLAGMRSELNEFTQPAMGMATASVYVGNLGCTGVKTPAVLGRAVQQSKVMQTVGMEMGLDAILDQASTEELKGVIVYTPVEIIKTEGGGVRHAYYLVEAHHAGAGEWMYTMDVTGAGEHYERAWELLTSGHLQQAADFFETLTESEAAMALVPRIRSYVDDVQALTGSVPTEYSRIIRPRGTLPAPVSEQCFFTRKISKISHQKHSIINGRSSTKLSSCTSLTTSTVTKSGSGCGATPPAARTLDHLGTSL